MKFQNPNKQFSAIWASVDGPPLAAEFQFHPTRRWRFDFAHPASLVAIEVEGGTWTHGRHSRGAGYAKDCEKYNVAAFHDWIVFRLTPDMIDTQSAYMIREAILRRTKKRPESRCT